MILNAILCLLLGEPVKKTIAILVYDDVLTSEITAPAEVFGRAANETWFADWQVQLVSLDQLTITTEEGLSVVADVTIDQLTHCEVLIVPGAMDTQALAENKQLMQLIHKVNQQGWVASHCSGAFILGHSGILKGKKATTWYGGGPDLQAQFQDVLVQTEQSIVIDGKNITSNGGLVSYDASFVLLAHLAGTDKAQQVFEHLQGQRLKSWSELSALMP